MASIRKLKKEAVHNTSELIEATQLCYILKSSDQKSSQKIIDDSVDNFDRLITGIHTAKKGKDRASLKASIKAYNDKNQSIVDLINAL